MKSAILLFIREFLSEIVAGKLFFKSIDLKERNTIIILKNYFIEKKMILMMGEYDQIGKLCARVVAGKSSFLVDRPPLHLLNDTLTYIGFDLKGAMTGAKSILGKKKKCPIIVNPYLGISLFPNKSPQKVDCIWFNPEHIIKTTAMGNETKVELSNGYSIRVDSKSSTFNDKIQTAKHLIRLSMERGNHPGPVTFYLEPKEGRQLSKEKTGKYNFSSLEDEQK
ncbi:competence protein ComK [Neobacillus sp. NPDC058068]|uniref:competence protein ComK n=1 Tax=Neobacillus sp. NPDC058068 TaxID=3346325 RepID=UPI0036DD2388